jgi:hypothetical protein
MTGAIPWGEARAILMLASMRTMVDVVPGDHKCTP